MSEIKISRGKIIIGGESKPADKVFDKVCENFIFVPVNAWHDPETKMIADVGSHISAIKPKRGYIISYKTFIAMHEQKVIDAFNMVD